MTKTPRILLHNSRTDHLAEWLSQAHPDAQYICANDHPDVGPALKQFQPDVAYCVNFQGSTRFPRDAYLGPHAPKWISNGGSGTDHLNPWNTGSVTVTNAAGVAADMMAEYVFGGFLHFMLDVPGLQADQHERIWDARRMVQPLRGKTLLIVGLGHTGRRIATMAQAFGLYVIGTRANPQPTDNVDEVIASDDLIPNINRADLIVISTPLLPSTRGMISAEAFAAMKAETIFADVSRGGVVDQTALAAALTNSQIRGAVVDVFETEPLPKESTLWDCPNLLISPHCSAVHPEWEKASFDFFLKNLQCYIDGEPLHNIVDPSRGY